MRFMIMGPQGVGKGTQANSAVRGTRNPAHLHRRPVPQPRHSQTALGHQAYEYMKAGELVPDEITNAMVGRATLRADTAAATCWTGSRAPWTRRGG